MSAESMPSNPPEINTQARTSTSPDSNFTRKFLWNSVAWPGADDNLFINIHTEFRRTGKATGKPLLGEDGKPVLGQSGRAFTSIDDALSYVHYARSLPNTVSVGVCMSSQSQSGKLRTAANGFEIRAAMRSQEDAVAFKSLWVEIDPDAYSCNSDLVGAFYKFSNALGLPPPSAIVPAGGRLHYLWLFNRPLPLAEWRLLALALEEATKRLGLKCNSQATSDATHIVPLPNGVVTTSPFCTYAVETIAEKLAPYQVPVPPGNPAQPQPSAGANGGGTLDQLLDQARDRYYYIKNIDRLYDKQDRMILNASQFGACEPSLRSGKSAPYIVFINANPRRYRSLTYRPGQPEIVMEDHEGEQFECVNTYQPGPDPVPGLANVWDVFCRHGLWMLGKKQFRILRDYMAWIIANPGVKPGWTIVIIGPQGVGKDWLVSVFRQALGPHNVAYIDFANTTQKFNADWALKQFVVMNEARQNKAAQAKETYNRIKTITGSLPATRRVEEKNVPVWHAPNIQAGIVLSNHEDAIALDHDDRRFVVLTCIPQVRPTQEFFDPLFAWCPRDDTKGEVARAQRRLAGAQLAAYLKQVDLSKFRPEEAPMTQGKQAMISAANPELEWMDSQFSVGGWYWNREVMAIGDVLDAWHRHAEFGRHRGFTLNSGAVTAKLRSLGYTARKEAVRVGGGQKIRPWLSKEAMARGLDKRPTEIKDVYLQPTPTPTSQPLAGTRPSAKIVDLLARQQILKDAADALGVPVNATPEQIAEARATKNAAGNAGPTKPN
jgi:Family of unknown function (DUF5906)